MHQNRTVGRLGFNPKLKHFGPGSSTVPSSGAFTKQPRPEYSAAHRRDDLDDCLLGLQRASSARIIDRSCQSPSSTLAKHAAVFLGSSRRSPDRYYNHQSAAIHYSPSLLFERERWMACCNYGRNTIRQIVKATNIQTSDPMLHPLLYIGQGVRYRKLEVILTTGIDKLGKAGETVKVAPGYFRNHLMPKLLAVPNIEKFANLIKEQRKILRPVEEEAVKVVTMTKEDKMKEYEKAAKRLDKTQLVLRRLINKEKFRSRSTKDEPIELQLAVTKDDLLAEVARQFGIQLAPENLHLVAPLSTCGEHEVQMRFPKSIPLPEGKVHWSLNVKIRSK